jgi:RNA polymerase sigma-70 factor (sigma-E family)
MNGKGGIERVDTGVQPAAVELPELGFVAFYQDRYTSMVRLAVLMLGDQQAAEEAAQDAFAIAYQRWSKIDSPLSYVRQVVINRCRDMLRRRKLADALRSWRRDLVVVEPREHLDDVLATLPPRQRAAIVLRFYEDLSVDDIAATLGTRPGTVKSLLHRGLARLREDIEP